MEKQLTEAEIQALVEDEIERRGLKPTGPAGRIMSKVGKAVDYVTGAGRQIPAIPEYTTRFGNTGSIVGDLRQATGMLTASDIDQMKAVISKNQPGTKFAVDQFENDVMLRPGSDQWEYINRPGLSARDVANFAAQVPGLYQGWSDRRKNRAWGPCDACG